MDPNAVLQLIREQVATYLDGGEADVTEMTEAFELLDSWLTGGGFLPSDWQRTEED